MAELATIARPYAEALFKAIPPGDAQTALEQIDTLAAVAGNEQMRQFADNPKVAASQVYDVITSVAKLPLADGAKNFLRTVIDNGRLKVLPEIADQFRLLVNERSGVSDAIIYSAFAIDAAQLAGLVTTLEKRFKRKLKATVEIDPGLIGGIRAVVGDEMLDTSVAARLEQMKVALTA